MNRFRILCTALALFFPLAGEDATGVEALNRVILSGEYEQAFEAMRYVTNLNARDAEGTPPIIAATRYNRHEGSDAVHTLLRLGADPNIRDRQGATPLN